MTERRAIQDRYPEDVAHCHGCGRLHKHGIRIRCFPEGDETVAGVEPKPHHVAIPGVVYGGWIVSVIDCHCVGTAAWARHRADELDPDRDPMPDIIRSAPGPGYPEIGASMVAGVD